MKMISIKFDPNQYATYQIHQVEDAKQMRMDDIVNTITKQDNVVYRGYTIDMYTATQPRHQLCFYHTDDIMKAFPKKTRDKVKAAFDYHIEIEEKDVSHVKEFQDMISYTEKRKGIVLRNADYFRTMMESYEDNSVLLFAYLNHDKLIEVLTQKLKKLTEEMNALEETAHKKHEVLMKRITKTKKELVIAKSDHANDGSRILVSALLLVRDANTTELLYSGLNAHYQQYYATYALRYRAIHWAFDHGCQRFNFGGVQGTMEDGLFEFKSAFNPNIDVYIGEFDIVIQKAFYHMIEVLIPKLKQWKLNMARRGKHNASKRN